jgi:hypothetical protein
VGIWKMMVGRVSLISNDCLVYRDARCHVFAAQILTHISSRIGAYYCCNISENASAAAEAASVEARAMDSSPEDGSGDDGYEEQDDSDSAAASDAAVVAPPDPANSEAARENPRKRSRTSSSAAMVVEDTVEERVNLTHPEPKNFPQRLMCVLQNRAAISSIWWVGDGKAVALHAKNLQEGTFIETHFQVPDYATFTRMFSRW